MPLISNSTVKLVKVTSLLDRPITGTAEYVIYCVDNGVDPKTFWIWRNSAWEEIYTTITDQYIITRQLTGLTITGGTVTSTDTILSAFGKLQNQLNSVASPMVYQGTWNANTNSPTLTSSTGTKGHVYRVTTSGATNIDGTTDWKSGDFIVFNGTTWDKWDSTDAVTSVNGYVGNVVLVKSDVGLGNVPNVDATNPANIVQNTNYRFVTDTEKTYWNGKQDALGYVPEDVANKATTMTGNTTSNAKYLTSKAVYDWGTSTFIPLNAPITGATKTKITYDSKGLVTAGADATTADIADSLNKRYVTDANLIVIGNTSNTNTGDETQSSIKTKLGEASATQDGYLSAFYWSAFNNKQSAISLTNIGNSGAASFIANTLNIPVYTISGLGGVSTSRNINTTAPLQGGGDLSADRTLSITQATISSSGYLSSTDWNTFNNKQNALSGGITNRVTKWTSSTGLGNSIIFDDGSLVGLGTVAPTAKLHVNNLTTSDSLLIEDSTNPDASPFVVDNNGNVGIGIATPSTLGRLVVQGNGANGLVLNTDSGTATNSTRLFFRQSDTNDVSLYNVNGNFRFAFGGTANNTSGNNKFVMSAGGSLLINATGSTISPVAPLTAYATGIASAAEEIARFAVYDVNNPGVLIGSTFMSIRNGSTTDSEFLPQLRGLQNDTSTLGSLDLIALSSTAQDIAGNTNPVFLIRSGNSTTGGALTNRITFQVRNGATSVIHAAGNNYVSFGNTAPLAKMHVTAGATGVPVLRLERTTTTAQYIEFENSASGNELRSYSVSSAAKPLLFSNTTDTSNTVPTAGSLDILFNILGDRIVTIGADKNVGINVITPSYALEVQSYTNSGIMTYNSTDVSSFITITSLPSVSNSIESRHNISAPLDFIINSTSSTGNDTTTSSLFKLQTFSKDAIVIDNAQKVGFGTAAPSVKVHINSTTSGAFRLVDTTQGAGKYLKSDANGVGTWSNLSVADTGLTLTTTGTSGPATLIGNTLNIPQIATPSLSDVMVVGNNTNDKNIIFNSSYGLEDSSGKSTLKFDTSDQVTITNTKTLVGSTNRSVLLINGSNVETSITAEKVTTGVSIKLATSYVCDTYSDTSVQFVDIVANNAYNTNLNISKSAMLIGSTLNSSFIDPDFRGAEYLHNYASNYTNRSLVDKEYVDTAVSTVTVGTAASVSHTVKTSVALTKGQAVYVSSADGTNMIVSKADYSTEGTSSKTMGLIAQNLAINGIGQVITEGLLAGLDTSAAGSEGDPVWLGDDGNLLYGLANKPVAPNHMVFIGIVTRKNNINGEIFVKVQNGVELDELHNIQITGTPHNNEILTYDATTSLWKPSFIPPIGANEVFRGRTFRFDSTTVDTYGGIASLNNASSSAIVPNTTLFGNRFTRVRYFASIVSTGRVTSIRSTDLQWFLSGGFRFQSTYRVADTAFSSNCQTFHGLIGSIAEIPIGGAGLIQASTLTNCIFVGNEGADTNLQVFHNDATGTCTKIDLGVNFPANRTAGSEMTTMYSIEIYNQVGTTNVKYRVINLESGAKAQGIITTNLPAITQGLAIQSARVMGTPTTNTGQWEQHKWGCSDITI